MKIFLQGLSCAFVMFLFGCATPEEMQRERLQELQARKVGTQVYNKFAHQEVLTMEEVLYLVKRGVDDDVIIDHLEASKSIFRPTQKEVETLYQAGASQDLLEFMVESGGGRLLEPRSPYPRGGYWSGYYDGEYPYYGGYGGGYYGRGYHGGGYYYRGDRHDHGDFDGFKPPHEQIRDHIRDRF